MGVPLQSRTKAPAPQGSALLQARLFASVPLKRDWLRHLPSRLTHSKSCIKDCLNIYVSWYTFRIYYLLFIIYNFHIFLTNSSLSNGINQRSHDNTRPLALASWKDSRSAVICSVVRLVTSSSSTSSIPVRQFLFPA